MDVMAYHIQSKNVKEMRKYRNQYEMRRTFFLFLGKSYENDAFKFISINNIRLDSNKIVDIM